MDKQNLKLQLKTFKLNSLLEITNAINNNFSSEQLFLLLKFILQNQLQIGKAIIFINDGGNWRDVMEFGVTETEKRHIDVESDLLHLYEITVLDMNAQKKHFGSIDVVIPVHHKASPLAYLLLGDIDDDQIRTSPIIKHLPFIQTLVNIIAVAIENKRLVRELIRQERVKKELELASEMQSMLFPSSLPNDDRLQIDAFYQPHQQVGGDYYDFIKLNDEEVVFCLADVSGKGVSAALLMANFQANLRAIVNYKTSLTDIAVELNNKVMDNANGEKYITLFIGKYNLNTRMLQYINAAHLPPIMLTKDDHIRLGDGCTGLGMFDELPNVCEGEIAVPENAVLICFTDGVVELENEQEEPFEEDNLLSILVQHRDSDMKALNHHIIQELNDHRGTMPFIDDIALLTLRFL